VTLQVEALTVRYGAITAAREVSLVVEPGELVVLIGPNGAGKTTLLSAIAGLLNPAAGRVRLDGADVTGASPDKMVRRGLALVPQHRRLFADLTVAENLTVAAVTCPARERPTRVARALERFPMLAERSGLPAGYLSGGQAQLLAVARALVSDPRLVLMDEPSLGLAPRLVDEILALIAELRDQGRTLLVVEQNARKAAEIADRVYVMRTGQIVDEGSGAEFAETDVFQTYLGGTRSLPEASGEEAGTL
jgi:branched-chain amino acid transport system ATP-binding protein